MREKSEKFLISALCFCMMFFVLKVSASAQETDDVTVHFTTVTGDTYVVDFPYSDDYFTLDNNEYHHEIARASIGLTVAAYRQGTKTDAGNYFESAGFSNINLKPYETLPTTDSICNCIASKKINDFTLIAVGICGGDYGREWASNFTVGNEERPVGFNQAAQIVIERIKEYILENKIDGKKVLWVTGQSRAGATANIVAADMTDSGMFERVYGYTFGTPRTTRDKGEYTNIFNIISKDDVVPKVPIPDWGYERFGTDMYLPAQEFDSDYAMKSNGAYNAIDNYEFRNNPELHGEFRVIFGYLNELIPDAETYTEKIQGNIRNIIASDSKYDVLTILIEIIREFEPSNDTEKQELDGLLKFLDVMTAKYVLYGNPSEKEKEQWLSDSSVGSNLTVDHAVTTYAAWMLSSEDGKELYSKNTEFIHLTVNTSADIRIFNPNGLVQTIYYDGTADYKGDGHNSDDIYLSYSRNREQVQLDLPMDSVYSVVFTPSHDEKIEVTAIKYNVNSVVPDIVFSTILDGYSGVPYVVGTTSDGNVEMAASGYRHEQQLELPARVPMSVITALEEFNVFNLSVYELAVLWIAVTGLVLAELLVHGICSIIRKMLRYERSELSKDITFAVNMILIILFCLRVWYYAPSLMLINELAMVIGYAFMVQYASKVKNKKLLLLLISAMVISLVISNYNVKQISVGGAALFVFGQIILITASVILRKKYGLYMAEKETTSSDTVDVVQ